MIGTSKKPRCFKGEKILLEYARKRVHGCTALFTVIGGRMFLPSVRSKTSEPVALILDNFSDNDMEIVDHWPCKFFVFLLTLLVFTNH